MKKLSILALILLCPGASIHALEISPSVAEEVKGQLTAVQSLLKMPGCALNVSLDRIASIRIDQMNPAQIAAAEFFTDNLPPDLAIIQKRLADKRDYAALNQLAMTVKAGYDQAAFEAKEYVDSAVPKSWIQSKVKLGDLASINYADTVVRHHGTEALGMYGWSIGRRGKQMLGSLKEARERILLDKEIKDAIALRQESENKEDSSPNPVAYRYNPGALLRMGAGLSPFGQFRDTDPAQQFGLVSKPTPGPGDLLDHIHNGTRQRQGVFFPGIRAWFKGVWNQNGQ